MVNLTKKMHLFENVANKYTKKKLTEEEHFVFPNIGNIPQRELKFTTNSNFR